MAQQQHSSGDPPQVFESTAKYNGIQDVSELSAAFELFSPLFSQIKHKQTMHELMQLQQENSVLDTKIRELTSSHAEMIQLRKDMAKMQQTNEMNNVRLNQLEVENESLRHRLGSVVQSPLSDNEKQQLIQDAQHHRLHSSAPASIALTSVSDFKLCKTIRVRPRHVCTRVHKNANLSILNFIVYLKLFCMKSKENWLQNDLKRYFVMFVNIDK